MVQNDAPIPTVKTEGGTAAVDFTNAQLTNNLIESNDSALIDSLNKEGSIASQDVKNIAAEIVNKTDNVAGIANGKTTRKEIIDANSVLITLLKNTETYGLVRLYVRF